MPGDVAGAGRSYKVRNSGDAPALSSDLARGGDLVLGWFDRKRMIAGIGAGFLDADTKRRVQCYCGARCWRRPSLAWAMAASVDGT